MINELLLQKAKKIKALILDVDGVFTDGTFYLTPDHQEIKRFHTQDGVGLKQLQQIGITIAIISGRNSAAVNARMNELGIDYVFQGISNKIAIYNQIMNELNLNDQQAAYMGDDLPDLELIKRVALGIAPANAVAAVKQQADWVTERRGGDAAIREVADFIFNAQQCTLKV